jgi:outer membrane protein assembly factor BamB
MAGGRNLKKDSCAFPGRVKNRTGMTRLRSIAAVAVILTACGLAAAQMPRFPNETVTIRVESATTQKRLAEAQDKIRNGNASEAMAELQRILDENGDDLVSSGPSASLIPARRIVHALIGSLPEPILNAYRERIDSAANALYDKGLRNRTDEPLHELLDRYFHARITPNALLLMGELELERGNAFAAESTWRRILPDPAKPGWNVATAPKDAAAIRARIALAVLRQGDNVRSQAAMDSFQKSDGEASGLLAGRDGRYLDTLRALNKQFVPDPSATSPTGTWATLGGSSNRSGRVDSRLPVVWPSAPTWRSSLPPTSGKPLLRNPAEASAKSATNHAVILNGYAYVAEADRIFSYELATGRSALAYILPAEKRLDQLLAEETRLQARPDADYTLSIGDGRVYACLGSPGRLADDTGRAPWPSRFLAELEPNGAGKLTAAWLRAAPGPAGSRWEGTPALDGGRIIAPVARVDNGRLVHSLVALDRSTREPLWQTDIADSPYHPGDGRVRHELVTIADGLVIASTHSGAVIALHARTGKPAWAVRYPSARPSGKALVLASTANHRDIAVPIAHCGMVFVAPIDGDRLMAVELSSGRIVWEQNGLRTESIVGVSGTRLIATLAGPVRGIRGFDILTGSDETPAGWRNHDDPGLASLGRGLVSDDQILWPTKAGLFVLRPQDGRLARPPMLGPHGNLAYREGVLIVVNPTEVLGYVIPETARRPRPVPTETSPPIRIAITAPATVAASTSHFRDDKRAVLPTIPRRLSDPIALTGVSGVIPFDRSDHVWLVGERGGLPVSQRGEMGDAVPGIPVGARGFSIGSAPSFFTDTSLLRPDTQSRFDVRTLHADAEAIVNVAAGHGLVVLQIGEHHLAGLDSDTFRVRWVTDASGRAGYWPYRQPSAPRFGPHWRITPAGVIVQRSDGHAACLDLTNGLVRYTIPTLPAPWTSPPVWHRDRVIVPGEPGRIIAFDPRDGDSLWSFSAGNESGLTGESPHVRMIDETLFVIIPRNHGTELLHLSPDQGKAKWRRPVFLGPSDFDLASADADGATLLIPSHDRVAAVRLIDGRLLWTKPLAESPGGWRVTAAAGGVIVMPCTALPRSPSDASYAFRSFVRYPDPRRAFGILTTMGEPIFERTVPLLVCDPNTGREIRRFDLPAIGPGVDSRFHATGGVVATTGRIYLFQ